VARAGRHQHRIAGRFSKTSAISALATHCFVNREPGPEREEADAERLHYRDDAVDQDRQIHDG
jgi:hypothetical protein